MCYFLFTENVYLHFALSSLGDCRRSIVSPDTVDLSDLFKEEFPTAALLDFSTPASAKTNINILYLLSHQYPEIPVVVLKGNHNTLSCISRYPSCNITYSARYIINYLNAILKSAQDDDVYYAFSDPKLTDKQASIMYLVCLGLSYKLIARILGMKTKTVYVHYYYSLSKLNVSRVFEFAHYQRFLIKFIQDEYPEAMHMLSYYLTHSEIDITFSPPVNTPVQTDIHAFDKLFLPELVGMYGYDEALSTVDNPQAVLS